MSLAAALMQELEVEAATTRRVLERVPEEHFDWSPAPKSRTLGELAIHIAGNPGNVLSLASKNPADLPGFGIEPAPASTSDLLRVHDESVAKAMAILSGMSDADFTEVWRARANGVEIMAVPRISFLRAVFLNHWYHHRGQLSVYLRILDIPVPSIYGPSADENPFG